MRAATTRIGQLRHRLTIERETKTPDGQGGTGSAWGPLATVWGSIDPLQGRELFAAQQVNAHTSHKITIRYFAGLTAADRIAYGTRRFNIRVVLNSEERNRFLEFAAEEFSA